MLHERTEEMWWIHALVMFVGMIVIQVFAMPYMMAERPDHVYFSITQGWMGAAMGAAMVALGGLLHPMPLWAWLLCIIVGVVSVLGYRLQWLISDREYIREMIPHHSMALVTSRPRVRESQDPVIVRLAEQIITVQEREIAEMKHYLQRT
jgi:hypothetical protein